MSQGWKAAERLAGRTVMITGASSGIGKAVALEFCAASNGELKLILAARRLEKLEELKMKIKEEYPQAKVCSLPLDVSDLDAVERFLEGVPEEFRDIDVLVNNAGFSQGAEKVGELNRKGMEAVFKTNVLGLITLTQVVLRIFKQKNSGDIINIGSILGRDTSPQYSIYCASKYAVRAFSSTLLKELIDTKIRVIEIAPGLVRTDFFEVVFKGNQSEEEAIYKGYEPLSGEDIAEAVVYASSRNRNAVVTEMVLMPTAQSAFTEIHRSS